MRSKPECKGYKIEFERNVKKSKIFINDKLEEEKLKDTVKKEIDIVIYNESEKKYYAIELKFPRNKQYPEQMYSFIKDINFMEQLEEAKFNETFCFVIVVDELFYTVKSRAKGDGIYEYFRNNEKTSKLKEISGLIYKPTGEGKGKDNIELTRTYTVHWEKIPGTPKDSKLRYYILAI